MKKATTVTLALAAGLFGGLLSRVFAPSPAHAQDAAATEPAKEIRAQSFVLLDQMGKEAATFSVESNNNTRGARIVLRDPNGRTLWSAGGSGIRPASER